MEITREEIKFPGYYNNNFSARLQSYGKGLTTVPHYHDCIEVLYCTEGSFAVYISEDKHIISSGDMIMIFMDEIHKVYSLDDNNNAYLVIKYNPEMLFSLSESAYETKFLVSFTSAAMTHDRLFLKDDFKTDVIPRLMQDMIYESSTKGFGYEIATRTDISRLFLWIVRTWQSQHKMDNLFCDNDVNVISSLQKVFNYVKGHYMDKIKMETIASMLNMSYSSFSKFFTVHTGKNFHNYLDDVRLIKSKILLLTTGMNITEIALEVGFETTSYFIQRFKKKNNLTPQQYRNQSQNN